MRSLQWDIFCKVVDNFGDIGICWRLSADLAARGQTVRLWVDDASALSWMAPAGCKGVHVLPWTESIDTSVLRSVPCDVLVEAFGCEIAPEFVAACTCIHWSEGQNYPEKPLWINLEYLSAEPYVARSHGLTSLLNSGPATGWHKVFYYPGFTPDTGGLLRERDLLERQSVFDRAAWLQQQEVDWQGENGEVLVSMFCYEPPALAQLLDGLAKNGIDGKPVRLLVAAGRANLAVKEALKAIKASKTPQNTHQIGLKPNGYMREQLSISYLPQLTQTDFDRLLWASDINFVRGEDSIVRAIWAGKPFVWQLYPQDDGAHEPKLEAFLDMLGASAPVRAFHRVWNSLANQPQPPLTDLHDWKETVATSRSRLAQQRDLTSGLVKYALKNR
jgi:uncharacterized repeat protein (TIGR03837 family)